MMGLNISTLEEGTDLGIGEEEGKKGFVGRRISCGCIWLLIGKEKLFLLSEKKLPDRSTPSKGVLPWLFVRSRRTTLFGCATAGVFLMALARVGGLLVLRNG
jgi:hypothetical protein